MIVKVNIDEELLEMLDAKCRSTRRSRPMMILHIMDQYFKEVVAGTDKEVIKTIKKVVEVETDTPAVEESIEVAEEVEELDIPMNVFDF